MVTKRYFAALKQDKFTMPRISLSRRLAMEARESDDDDAPPPSKRVAVCKATEASDDNALPPAKRALVDCTTKQVRVVTVGGWNGMVRLFHVATPLSFLDDAKVKPGAIFNLRFKFWDLGRWHHDPKLEPIAQRLGRGCDSSNLDDIYWAKDQCRETEFHFVPLLDFFLLRATWKDHGASLNEPKPSKPSCNDYTIEDECKYPPSCTVARDDPYCTAIVPNMHDYGYNPQL